MTPSGGVEGPVGRIPIAVDTVGTDPAAEGTVDVSIRGPIGYLTLNRPAERNAINLAMAHRLAAAVSMLEDDLAVLGSAVTQQARERAAESVSTEAVDAAVVLGYDRLLDLPNLHHEHLRDEELVLVAACTDNAPTP
jgi:hypothetical protein